LGRIDATSSMTSGCGRVYSLNIHPSQARLTKNILSVSKARKTRGSALLVVLQIAVDQAGDVIRIALFLFEEGFVGHIVLDFDVVIRHDGCLVASGVRIFQRH